MNDLTILYCTASLLNEYSANKFREHLLFITEGKYPIVSVSQKPLDFGYNVPVGEVGQSNYNFFMQIFFGAALIRTKYIAHVDDDTLYIPEHFTHRPPDDQTFIHNNNSWINGSKTFWRKKDRWGMYSVISPTQALIENLRARFVKYPIPPKDDRHFGEPGKFDTEFGIPNAKTAVFNTKLPLVRFEYRGSLNGKTKRFGLPNPNDFTDYLEPYGNAKDLRKQYGFT